jgi:hypothetical protein
LFFHFFEGRRKASVQSCHGLHLHSSYQRGFFRSLLGISHPQCQPLDHNHFINEKVKTLERYLLLVITIHIVMALLDPCLWSSPPMANGDFALREFLNFPLLVGPVLLWLLPKTHSYGIYPLRNLSLLLGMQQPK